MQIRPRARVVSVFGICPCVLLPPSASEPASAPIRGSYLIVGATSGLPWRCLAASCAPTSRSILAGSRTSRLAAPLSWRRSRSNSASGSWPIWTSSAVSKDASARVFDGGFAIELKVSQHKREKLAAQITWLVNKDELGGAAGRRHQRTRSRQQIANAVARGRLTRGLPGAGRLACRAPPSAPSARPPIGDIVMFGKLRCKVMRYHDRGIGVQFLDIPDPEALRRYFG